MEQKIVRAFDKGIIDAIGDEKIPDGASSSALNFLHLGDKVEITRGRQILGASTSGSGSIKSVITGVGIDGTEYTYRRRGTVVELLDNTLLTWSSVLTGLTDGEDMFFESYRTPAGSFIIFSSPNTGLYRINLANPSTVHNFYTSARNFKGNISINDNRLFLWGDVNASTLDTVGNDAVLRLSYIDNDFPYTDITGEALGSASGGATYTGTFAQDFLVGRTLVITHSSETFTDVSGIGTLTGSLGGTGTVNYTTGAWSITFASAQGSGAITASYAYEKPTDEGILDFRYTSPTRLAGEGAFFFQAQSGDTIQNVFPYDGNFYVAHDKSFWLIDLTDDDTQAINKIYRRSIGMPSKRGGVATGDGIYFIDVTDSDNKTLRLLRYNDLSSKVIPVPVSDSIDLNAYEYDNACMEEHGDYILLSCRSSADVSYNDITILYNRKWKLFDKIDWGFNDFMKRDGALYGASSHDLNVYELFSGFDDEGLAYDAYFVTNDSTLDIEQLKKVKRFVVEGDIEESQELIIDVAYDGGEFSELGRVAGTSQYVNRAISTEYGKILYGGGVYGSGDPVTAYRYMREFRLKSDKFYRIQIRFRTSSIGYLSVIQYIHRDIRSSLVRVPSNFR